MKKIIALVKEEDGAALIEYVMLAALIGIAAFVGMDAVGKRADSTLLDAEAKMTGAAAS
jgi:Flp pilus assembly pilin Flp